MNALRVPYEAHTSVVGFASEGSALRSMWRSHGLQAVGAPLQFEPYNPMLFYPVRNNGPLLCSGVWFYNSSGGV
jgi:hypothetical protein